MNYVKIMMAMALLPILAIGQATEKLETAFNRFTNDSQMKYAISSLMVVETATGKTVFAKNEKMGLAPASCLKIITSATAFEILGTNYTYNTPITFQGDVSADGILKGDVVVKASGDPSLGTWRFESTKSNRQLAQLAAALSQAGVKEVQGRFVVDGAAFETQATPGGWIFEDIGNYYGAGSGGFNWNENQYDLVLNPGENPGDRVRIAATRPVANAITLTNELRSGPKGSGDNAIIYPDKWPGGTVRGTVPAGVKEFTIGGSIQDPVEYWGKALAQYGDQNNLDVIRKVSTVLYNGASSAGTHQKLTTLSSPTLDSLIFYYMRRSINLYGEAFVKTMAVEKGKKGSTDEGVLLIRNFWKDKGIETGALKIKDGSGLSPQNRVTTQALVTVLQYARNRSWYNSFYESIPTINGIKMKSGTIGGAKGYTGYITGKDGTEYSFAFLVNNFDGFANSVVQKMWQVLDVLAK